ncbi:MAG: hypothetical protein EHM81_02940 [Chloroflexi bacterium]|nr:MAG: hypothetical protein EHM81_02940 [Chloroflexota bacterium]
MFDDLRKDSDASAFFQEEEPVEPLLDVKPKKRSSGGLKINDNNFLGMTAFQRFVISIMLMMVVCILGAMFLLVTEKILPF